ncbi:MAG: hypothetical protein Q7T14_02505, partial [Aestuariivirga sp.]|nr:hypothetical protein [Aestuariivirga sp.]
MTESIGGFYGALVIRLAGPHVMCWNPCGIQTLNPNTFPGDPMKKLLSLMALGLCLSMGVAHAA